ARPPPLPGSMRLVPLGSNIATRRITQASPSCHFHGKPWNVQRLPVTRSRSGPTVSIVGVAPPSSTLCAAFHSRKALEASPPFSFLYSGSRYLICGPLRCGPSEVAIGWSTQAVSTPTSLTFFFTSHSAAFFESPGARPKYSWLSEYLRCQPVLISTMS